jgi:hypothetical protein
MNWEPPSSLSSLAFEEKNQELTMSLSAHRHFLHLRKKLRNDDKPFGSLSSVTLEGKKKKNDDKLGRFVVIVTPKKK